MIRVKLLNNIIHSNVFSKMISVWSCLIFTFALLKNIKLCPGKHYILGHSAVISDTVYLEQLLMANELIGTSMMNVEQCNQCKPSYPKTW